MLEPFRLVGLCLAPARLINGEDRGIEDAVAQRLQTQRRQPRLGIARHDLAAAGAVVEIIEDDAGILPSGFCLRTLSLTSLVSAASIFTSLSRPSSEIAIRTLRPNGEAGEERRIIMATPLTLLIVFTGVHFCGNALQGAMQQIDVRPSGRTVLRHASCSHTTRQRHLIQ